MQFLSPQDRARINGALLTEGAHDDCAGTCALELVSLVLTDRKVDTVPEFLSRAMGILPLMNDALWDSDEQRTATIVPYLEQLIACSTEPGMERAREVSKLDYAVRTVLPEALRAEKDVSGLARRLEALAPLSSDDSITNAMRLLDAETAYLTGSIAQRLVVAARFLLDGQTGGRGRCRVAESISIAIFCHVPQPLSAKRTERHTHELLKRIIAPI